MTAMVWSSDIPVPAQQRNVRFGLALAVSVVFHLIVLLPANGLISPPAVVASPPLQVELPLPDFASRLATYPELPEPAAIMPPPATAVPPAPTFPGKRLPLPRELQGRELDAALAALMHEEIYPRAAIDAGLEGRVVLLLMLDVAGRITAVEVAGSSGHALLDDAALRAATRIAALPGGRRQVLLPVEFRLE